MKPEEPYELIIEMKEPRKRRKVSMGESPWKTVILVILILLLLGVGIYLGLVGTGVIGGVQ